MSLLRAVRARSEGAIAEAVDALDGNPSFERLSAEKVESRKRGYLVGWKTVEQVKEIGYNLELYLPKFFPDAPPEVYVADEPRDLFLKNPHVERDGRICILAESASIDANLVVDLLNECLQRAFEVLALPDLNDFRDESLVYWSLSGGTNQYEVYCCSPLAALSLHCALGVSGKVLVLAEDADSAERWLENWRGEKAKLEFVAPCVVASLNKVLLPSEYPATYADVKNVLENYSPESVGEFLRHSCKSSKLFGVIFVQDLPEGKILAGVVAYGKQLDHRSKLIHGFRPGQAPAPLLWNRGRKIFRREEVKTAGIVRADADWIHSRGGIGADFSRKRVTLIGCGSLGGYVAHLLARTGIGKISLLDNDILTWDNVGRHLLGASDVKRSKSEALALKLQRELPHLDISHFYGDWREWIQNPEGEEAFSHSDLIISTVADWRCERPLNWAIQKSEGINAVYSWLEPYGLAGQVLISRLNGGCLECGMDGLGNFRERVLEFQSSTLRKEPGGCAFYQQYGPTKIVPLAGLIVDASVEVLTGTTESSELWTVLGDLRQVDIFGGSIREPYQQKSTTELSRTLRRSWHSSDLCVCCNEEVQSA